MFAHCDYSEIFYVTKHENTGGLHSEIHGQNYVDSSQILRLNAASICYLMI